MIDDGDIDDFDIGEIINSDESIVDTLGNDLFSEDEDFSENLDDEDF